MQPRLGKSSFRGMPTILFTRTEPSESEVWSSGRGPPVATCPSPPYVSGRPPDLEPGPIVARTRLQIPTIEGKCSSWTSLLFSGRWEDVTLPRKREASTLVDEGSIVPFAERRQIKCVITAPGAKFQITQPCRPFCCIRKILIRAGTGSAISPHRVLRPSISSAE